jgi:uncharacterized protein YecE (DUF72 family)
VNFGKIPEEEWGEQLPKLAAEGGFKLAPDHADNVRGLAGGQGLGNVRSGGTMWTVRGWRGSVYPEKDPQRTWIGHYGRAFQSLELNATHYKIHPPERMKIWADAMPEGFKFCPKFPAIITRYRKFNNCEGPTDDFIEALLALGDKLGTSFIQLTPQFMPRHGEKLARYLEAWPRELKMAIEFRHPGWFEGGADAEAIWAQMTAQGVGSVLSDTALRRDAAHMRMTAPQTIIRFGGYAGHPSDQKRLQAWSERIKAWTAQGLDELDFLVHQPDSLATPATCEAFNQLSRGTS